MLLSHRRFLDFGICTWRTACKKRGLPSKTLPYNNFSRAQLNTSAPEPLRILFCGSDAYSVACLDALYREYGSGSSDIASIDVVCRPGKPVGRGYKHIRHPPIRGTAQELGLRLHEIDTFTRWEPPSINLIVAVSFGLFIPPRLLRGARYGGINVHPSLLPDFRGAAPLHWTLLMGDTHTGATVQTLHHEKFDHGTILAQTSPPGLKIPPNATYDDLLELVKPESAELLLNVIRHRSFEKYSATLGQGPGDSSQQGNLRKAPKITPQHRRIDWNNWSAQSLVRRQKVLGRLWTTFTPDLESENNASPHEPLTNKPVRVIFGADVEVLDGNNINGHSKCLEISIGVPYCSLDLEGGSADPERKGLLINTQDGGTILLPTMTVEGDKTRPAVEAAIKHGMMSQQCPTGHGSLYAFRHRLD